VRLPCARRQGAEYRRQTLGGRGRPDAFIRTSGSGGITAV
jgi:hypothetical protein